MNYAGNSDDPSILSANPSRTELFMSFKLKSVGLLHFYQLKVLEICNYDSHEQLV